MDFIHFLNETKTNDLKWTLSSKIHPKYTHGVILTYANPQIKTAFKDANKLFKLLNAKKEAYKPGEEDGDKNININTTKNKLNDLLNREFFKLVQHGNYMYPISIEGKYGSKEPAYIFYNMTVQQGEELALMFGQHSFIYFSKSENGKFSVSAYTRKYYDKNIYYKTQTTTEINYFENDVKNFYSKKRNFKFSFDFDNAKAFPETKYISALVQFIDEKFYSMFKFMNKKQIKEYNKTYDDVMFINKKSYYLREKILNSYER